MNTPPPNDMHTPGHMVGRGGAYWQPTSHGGAPGQAHYPWDDVNTVDDEPGTAWHELSGLAVGFLCFQVVVFVLAFSLGVLIGMRS
jgi:hypothetical protein